MLPLKTLVHPTDFSATAAYAFRLACDLARDHGARLFVLHVLPAPLRVLGGTEALPPTPEEIGLEWAEAQLRQLRPDDGVPVETCLRLGAAAQEIIRLAQETSCDLIVIGTHGRTGLRRVLLGSVAEQVLRGAACPVVTVKAPDAAGND
jgi:nucleotide-binding universal stress UspA family protein